MRRSPAHRHGGRKGKLTNDPERARLVELGIEWGRTADELAETMNLTDLLEILSVYEKRAEAMEEARNNRGSRG